MHRRGADVHTETFSTLLYRSRHIEALSSDRYHVIGDPTIRDGSMQRTAALICCNRALQRLLRCARGVAERERVCRQVLAKRWKAGG